jgi:CrcB protein
MKEILYVALGGGLGAVARFTLVSRLSGLALSQYFPLATLTVNIIGCFLAGVLFGLTERYNLLSSHQSLFLFTGVLGGFTTFSAFGVDCLYLLRKGESMSAMLYVGASTVLGIAAVVGGAALTKSH